MSYDNSDSSGVVGYAEERFATALTAELLVPGTFAFRKLFHDYDFSDAIPSSRLDLESARGHFCFCDSN